jgi:hypothetical protein
VTSILTTFRTWSVLTAVAIFAAALTALPASGAATASPAGTATFGGAVELPAPPQHPASGRADSLSAVSCATPAWCAAGGEYFDASGDLWPMVTAQVRGRWTHPAELQLPDNQTGIEFSGINGLACPAAGDCVAVGSYSFTGGGGRYTAFIATDVAGTWQPAWEAWLPANAAEPQSAQLNGISCTGPRTCVASGWYFDGSGNQQLMVITETNGTWARAREIAAPSNAAHPVSVASTGISCYRSGDCVAVGGYRLSSGEIQPLTFRQSGGTWHQATAVALPANAAGGQLQGAPLNSVSCATTGFCVAVGSYLTGSRYRPIAVTGSGGLGGRAAEVTALPGAAGRDPYLSDLFSVSCASASSCVATGQVAADNAQPFYPLALQWHKGRWGSAQTIGLPGVTAKNAKRQDGVLWSVSCYRTGYCVTVGEYDYQASLDLNGASMAAVRG